MEERQAIARIQRDIPAVDGFERIRMKDGAHVYRCAFDGAASRA